MNEEEVRQGQESSAREREFQEIRQEQESAREQEFQEMRRRMRRERESARERDIRNLRRLLFRLALLSAAVLGGLWVFAAVPRIPSELVVEAGSPLPTAADFVKGGFFEAEVLSGLDDSINMHNVGAYPVTLRVLNFDRKVLLRITDTVPPKVEVRDWKTYDYEQVTADQFVVSVEDETPTTAHFATEPDMGLIGVQEVQIAVTDAGGNRTVKLANLEVVQDDVPPVIEGVRELTVTLGGSVSYKKDVTVSDNLDEAVELSIDNSQVNLKKAGNYPVVYSAVDSAGNRTEVSTVLHVVNPKADAVTQEALDIVADQVLAEILSDGMSQYEQAKAIYNFCRYKIGYVDSSEKDDWIKAAWQGITRRQGDCFVYYSAARELLTRAGIKNTTIERIPRGNSMHYWNLIDIGEGWHHFDTTPRAMTRDGVAFKGFYLTDSELMAYSEKHRGTHNYDHSLYPDVVP